MNQVTRSIPLSVVSAGQAWENQRQALRSMVSIFRPPPRQTVSEWSDAERRLSSESSAEPGRWRTDRVPPQRGIMDAVNDRTVREIWVMKSAQVGYTETLLNVIGYHVDQDPSPILVVQPTVEIAETFSKDRLSPMVRDTPALTGKIADPKSRDSGNTILRKNFRGGHITIAGANSPSGLASRPIRVLICDEVDKYPTTAGSEGDPISLARKRTTAFWNRKMLAGSTPTIKGQSRVEAGFMGSDQRYFHVPCPHCGAMQRLIWAQVKWTEFELAAEDAVYQCVHCGATISDVERIEALQHGEWRASKPFTGIAGFHVNELMSPFVTMGEMATAFLEAKKLPETLQTWVNSSLGETFEDTARSIEPEGLAARREQYSTEMLPAGTLMLTLGVDTQDDRLEGQLVAWGAEEESWILEQRRFPGDPGVGWNKGVWRDLTLYRRQKYMTEDGRTLTVQAAAVDFGGHFSQQVANYAFRYRFERVFAIRGAGGVGRLAWPRKPGKTKLSKADLYTIGVDTIKDLLYGRLGKITAPDPGEPKPGFIHLPVTADEDFCDQLVSETKLYRQVQGRRVAVWRPKRLGVRQEAQDCWVYAYAAMLGRGINLNELAAALAAKLAKFAGSGGGKKAPRPQTRTQAATPPPTEPPPDPAPKRKKKPRFRTARSSYLTR